jgi:hypothetical protein
VDESSVGGVTITVGDCVVVGDEMSTIVDVGVADGGTEEDGGGVGEGETDDGVSDVTKVEEGEDEGDVNEGTTSTGVDSSVG